MKLHNPTERVINILKLISKDNDNLTLTTISKKLSIPKSTLSPILKTLLETEFLIMDPVKQTYEIGLTSFQVGQNYLKNINGLDIIKSHMRIIVNECNETCQLGINHKNEVLYLTKIESQQPIKLLSSIGRNLPLYCTGLGRVLLFEYSEEKIRELCANNLEKFTEYTITDTEKLIKIINKFKKNNYAFEKQEISIDAYCVAVPIVINNSIQAALGISMPVIRAKGNHLNKIINTLFLHSKFISQELTNLNIKHIL